MTNDYKDAVRSGAFFVHNGDNSKCIDLKKLLQIPSYFHRLKTIIESIKNDA